MLSQPLEQTLQLRSALSALQKELLSHLKETFEKGSARQIQPAEWLQVIMGSERFAWLRELTSLIADIDLLTELPLVTAEQATVARWEVDRLFFEVDSQAEFSKHYRQILPTGAPLLLTHGLLRQAAHEIPAVASAMTHEKALAARKSWQEEHRLSRLKRRS